MDAGAVLEATTALIVSDVDFSAAKAGEDFGCSSSRSAPPICNRLEESAGRQGVEPRYRGPEKWENAAHTRTDRDFPNETLRTEFRTNSHTRFRRYRRAMMNPEDGIESSTSGFTPYLFVAGAIRCSSSKKLKMKTTLSCFVRLGVCAASATANRTPSGCRSNPRLPTRSR
jgi:hypothetical protein